MFPTYAIMLDASDRWCVVLQPGPPPVAWSPHRRAHVTLEAPFRQAVRPLELLRVQPTGRLVVALLAWHALGDQKPEARQRVGDRVLAALAEEAGRARAQRLETGGRIEELGL